jgi:hypothetical protein
MIEEHHFTSLNPMHFTKKEKNDEANEKRARIIIFSE